MPDTADTYSRVLEAMRDARCRAESTRTSYGVYRREDGYIVAPIDLMDQPPLHIESSPHK